MSFEYIIVQAGGRGSRMGQLTENKPKALVPIDNLPLIFHLFKKYPDKKFLIIGDYKIKVLNEYLKAFAQTDFTIVDAEGKKGTCSGLQKALSLIPDKKSFMLIWCDLVLDKDFIIGESDKNLIGISDSFVCRWKYENGTFCEAPSSNHGVAGLFVFTDKKAIEDVPEEGEFVRWLCHKDIDFQEIILKNAKEYGVCEAVESTAKRCRPFNRMLFTEDKVYKSPTDSQGETLKKREIAWYKKVRELGFENIPLIYEYDPLTMELIKGKNIYEYADAPYCQKQKILGNIVNCLKQLHSLGTVKSDSESYYDAYLRKTYDRLQKIRNLVPFANDRTVVINGRVCRNVFYYQTELETKVMQYFPKNFNLIHGDCTFSNIMLKSDGSPVLIDPRGYFGNTEIYGDVAYDWVKLYYSLFSNYDRFNLKNFSLKINEDNVSLTIESNNWEALEEDFFELIGDTITKNQMKLLLAITWLSLTTYAWEDYDSICAAFYNGLYFLEEAL